MRVSSGKSLRLPHFDCGSVNRIGRDGMKLPRRQFLHLAGGAAVLPVASRVARAQTYPARPVRWIVGFSPGGSADIHARQIAMALGAAWPAIHYREPARGRDEYCPASDIGEARSRGASKTGGFSKACAAKQQTEHSGGNGGARK